MQEDEEFGSDRGFPLVRDCRETSIDERQDDFSKGRGDPCREELVEDRSERGGRDVLSCRKDDSLDTSSCRSSLEVWVFDV